MHVNVNARGFSLIEMALVVFVMSMLLGAVFIPLSTRSAEKQRAETLTTLRDVHDALMGFAMVNGRLPCPDIDTIPNTPGYGIEELNCGANPIAEGFLPTSTLGLPQATDAYGERWRYRVDRNFAVPFTLSTACSADALTIVDPDGVVLHETEGKQADGITPCSIPASGSCSCPVPPKRPRAIVFSLGPNRQADGQNGSFEPTLATYQSGRETLSFDDVAVWVSPSVLAGRLVAAGKQP